MNLLGAPFGSSAPLEKRCQKTENTNQLRVRKRTGMISLHSDMSSKSVEQSCIAQTIPPRPFGIIPKKNHALQLILTPKILGPTDLLWTILFGESSLQTSNPNTDNGILTRLALFSNFDPQSPALKKWKGRLEYKPHHLYA